MEAGRETNKDGNMALRREKQKKKWQRKNKEMKEHAERKRKGETSCESGYRVRGYKLYATSGPNVNYVCGHILLQHCNYAEYSPLSEVYLI
jgi:hypothetical protein